MEKIYEDRIAFLESKVAELEKKVEKLDDEVYKRVIKEINRAFKR